MTYYFSKTIDNKSFDEAIEYVTQELKKFGFGIITEINAKNTFKEKLGVDFKKYMILGACNPEFAYKALSLEDKIGILLPCNVVVEEHDNGEIEVSAVDPIVSMASVENNKLGDIASEVRNKLKQVIDNL